MPRLIEYLSCHFLLPEGAMIDNFSGVPCPPQQTNTDGKQIGAQLK